MKHNVVRKKRLITVIGIVVVMFMTVLTSSYIIRMKNTTAANVNITAETNLLKFKESDLSIYNGDDPERPIYIGLNGYVYDVSSGRKFYEKGGTYHYLAGKDSSEDLNLIGGDIIKKKYPVVGILEN